MDTAGYIYVILRFEFIKADQQIYKIGRTSRYPPHKRLWEYPYGSLFLVLYRLEDCHSFENTLKRELKNNSQLIWRKDIGIEYFEGNLQIIIDTITKLYTSCRPKDVAIVDNNHPIDTKYLHLLNGIKYIPHFIEHKSVFLKLYNYRLPVTNVQVPQKDIYDAFVNRLKDKGLPDSYIAKADNAILQSEPKYQNYQNLVPIITRPIEENERLYTYLKTGQDVIPTKSNQSSTTKKELTGDPLKDYSITEILENPQLRKLVIKNADEKQKKHNEIMKKFAAQGGNLG